MARLGPQHHKGEKIFIQYNRPQNAVERTTDASVHPHPFWTMEILPVCYNRSDVEPYFTILVQVIFFYLLKLLG
jgi:hypothetical protein